MSVMVLGDCVLDVYVFYSGLRGTFNASKGPVLIAPGGACNVAIAAKRGGLDVLAVDLLGNDWAGQLLKDALIESGVNVSYIELRDGASTPVSVNLISIKKRHRFVGYFPPKYLLPKVDKEPDAVFFDGYAGLSTNAVKVAEELKGRSKVFFDPGPVYRGTESPSALKVAEYVLLNLNEYRRLKGLLKGKKAIVKMGARGAALYFKGRRINSKGINVQAATTVGAGDAFDGYFISAIIRGLSEDKALKLATAAAAEKVKGIGISSFPFICNDFKISKEPCRA